MANENEKIENDKLDQAWTEIENAISRLGKCARDMSEGEGPQYRYETYKTALALIADSYMNQIRHDLHRPETSPVLGPQFNWGLPNADVHYQLLQVEPHASYRVWGRRGDAGFIDMGQLVDWLGRNKKEMNALHTANDLFDEKISVDADGNFDFILSGTKPRDGQWLELQPNTTAILLRDVFTNYATQNRHTVFHIDRLDDDGKGSTMLSAEESCQRFEYFARGLDDLHQWFTFYQKMTKNEFTRDALEKGGGVIAQYYAQALFELGPDEALIGRWEVPEDAIMWSIQLFHHTQHALNWANRQTNLNQSMVKRGADGVFWFVVSQRDPGLANWIDTDGHERGFVLARMRGSQNLKPPTLQQVPFDKVRDYLPRDIALATPTERAAALAVRRRHYQLRAQC